MRNWHQRRWFLGATVALVLLALLAAFGAPWGAADVSPSVTDASLMRLNPGMTTDDVVETLGAPLQEVEEQGGAVWKYSRAVKHVRWYPEVALLFERGKLSEAFVERKTFWGADREIRYWMKRTGERWTAPGFSTENW